MFVRNQRPQHHHNNQKCIHWSFLCNQSEEGKMKCFTFSFTVVFRKQSASRPSHDMTVNIKHLWGQMWHLYLSIMLPNLVYDHISLHFFKIFMLDSLYHDSGIPFTYAACSVTPDDLLKITFFSMSFRGI